MRQIVLDAPSQPIRNLVLNPSFETSSTGNAANYGTATVTLTRPTTGGAVGGTHYRITFTAAGSYGSVGAYSGISPTRIPGIIAGQTHTASAFIRGSSALTGCRVGIEWYDSTGTRISAVTGTGVNLVANTWTRLSYTGVAPAGAVAATVTCYTNPTAQAFAVNDTVDVDGFMLTQTLSVPLYADGSYSGWKWDGTAHASSSVGYPLSTPGIRPGFTNGSTTGTSATVSLPADWTAADYLLLIVNINTAQTPISFTARTDASTQLATAADYLQAFKIVPTPTSASVVIGIPTSAVIRWWCCALTGVGLTAPVVAANNLGTNSTSPIEFPTTTFVTPTLGTELYLDIGAVNSSATWTATSDTLFSNLSGNSVMAIRSGLVQAGLLSRTATPVDRGLAGTNRLESAMSIILPAAA